MMLRRVAEVAGASGDAAQAEVARLRAERVKAQAEGLRRLLEDDAAGT